MTEIRSFGELMQKANYAMYQPSEENCLEVFNGAINLASQSTINVEQAKDVERIIPKNLNYVNETYSNRQQALLIEKSAEMVSEKDNEKTNRMSPVKYMS